MYDLIIIGAGPAGITASIYAARKKMDFLLISTYIGGQPMWTKDIQNYTGYQFVTGQELTKKFQEHLNQFNVKIKDSEQVILVKKQADAVKVKTNKDEYEAKTVIIASGKIPKRLEVKGEDLFRNKGVAYCATCDSPLFTDVDVVVVGNGDSALDSVLQLIKIARKIYIINMFSDFTADPVMVEKAKSSDKVVIFNNAKVTQICGDKFVKGIKIEKDGKEEDLPAEGVFIELGFTPASDFVEGINKNQSGEIVVNCKCETNIPGIFAAGDVTNIFGKQIIIACGEGAKATLAAFEYLSKKS